MMSMLGTEGINLLAEFIKRVYLKYYIRAAKALTFLPRTVRCRLAEFLGNLAFYISSEKRDMGLNLIFIKKKADTINYHELKNDIRKTYINFNLCLMDFLTLPAVNGDNIIRMAEIINKHHLDYALSRNKGVILLSAHIGNWELGGVALALCGYTVNAVYLPQGDRNVDDFFINQRTRNGVQIIPLGKSFKTGLRILRDNKILAVLGDLRISDKGVEVKLCDRNVLLPRGPALMAIQTGAAIIPGFTILQDNGTYRVFLEAPIICNDAVNREDEIRAVTQKFAFVLEKYVEQYPRQWFIFRNFWETS